MHKFPKERLIKAGLLMEIATESLIAACQAAVPAVRSVADAMTRMDPKIKEKLKGGAADRDPQ